MLQRITDQAAFLLHRRDYQNTSLIIELFTRDCGRISVLVKGAKKRRDISSFQMSHRLSVSWSGRSELKTLSQIESRMIDIPLKSFTAVFYANELLLIFLAKGEVYRDLFECYQIFLIELSHLDTSTSDTYQQQFENLLRNFEMDMLHELGYMPDLGVERDGGHRVRDEEYYQLGTDLGIIKNKSQENDNNFFQGQQLKAIQKRDFSSSKTLLAAKKILRQIIDFNLQGRTLQSREFYKKINLYKSLRN